MQKYLDNLRKKIVDRERKQIVVSCNFLVHRQYANVVSSTRRISNNITRTSNSNGPSRM